MPENSPQPRLGYAWYVAIVLMVMNTLSYVDRQILALLVGPIKHELGISDTQIGILQGLAFAVFYTVLGLPMGRIADHANRRNLISAGVFAWSIMTALCAGARSFPMLFLARLGVGVGEATLGPSAFSLTSDYFPKERLGTALSVFSAGIFIGSGLALIVGGAVIAAVTGLPSVTVPILGTIAPWRLTFIVVGLPGILGALLMFTVREPIRRNAVQGGQQLSLTEVAREVRLRWQSVVGVCVGQSAQAMCVFALQAWLPTFFIRAFGWTPQRTGITLGIIILTTGCLGMCAGGTLCDLWQKRGLREAPIKVGVVSTIGAGLCTCLALGFQYPLWTVALMIPAYFLFAMPVGSCYASLQLIFPNQLRGQVGALLIFAINVGGMVMGPWLVGMLNDILGAQKVGYSLALAIGVATTLSVTVFRRTYAPYRRHHALMHP